MSNLYKDLILDHYKHPRNFGELKNPDATGREANATCGDLIEFQIRLKKGLISEVAWRGIGCAISTASASLLSEKISQIKQSANWRSQIRLITEKDLLQLLGGEITSARMKCATLPLFALQAAIKKLDASFLRKQESIYSPVSWIPAFPGMALAGIISV